MGIAKRKIVMILLLEVGMLLGIFLSLFLVPPNFPFFWFLVISATVFAAANVLILTAFNNAPSGSKYRMGTRAYLAIALAIISWLVFLISRRL